MVLADRCRLQAVLCSKNLKGFPAAAAGRRKQMSVRGAGKQLQLEVAWWQCPQCSPVPEHSKSKAEHQGSYSSSPLKAAEGWTAAAIEDFLLREQATKCCTAAASREQAVSLTLCMQQLH